MNNVIAYIILMNNDQINAIFIDRKVELMGSTPVGFYLKVKTDNAEILEIPYSSILKIDYKQL